MWVGGACGSMNRSNVWVGGGHTVEFLAVRTVEARWEDIGGV